VSAAIVVGVGRHDSRVLVSYQHSMGEMNIILTVGRATLRDVESGTDDNTSSAHLERWKESQASKLCPISILGTMIQGCLGR
jgi:hypothetical protein